MAKNKLERFLSPIEKPILPNNIDGTVSQEYMDFYDAIGTSIDKKRSGARASLDKAMNVVLDGNLYSLDGYSNDGAIEEVQKKAGELMGKLCDSVDLCELETVSLNSTLSSALSIPEDEDLTYFQTLYADNNGNFSTVKPSNIVRSVLAHPNKILMFLKNLYLMGVSLIAKEVVSFVWVFLETIAFFAENSKIEITPAHVLVVLYIQMYAAPSIAEEKLISLIDDKKLSFDSQDLNKLMLDNDMIKETINSLVSYGIIKIESGDISLVEAVKLKVSILEHP